MKNKSNTKSLSCEDALKHVYDYIDGSLNKKSDDEIEHHLKHCHSCFGRFEFERLLKDKMSSLKNVKQKRKHIDNILNRVNALQ